MEGRAAIFIIVTNTEIIIITVVEIILIITIIISLMKVTLLNKKAIIQIVVTR